MAQNPESPDADLWNPELKNTSCPRVKPGPDSPSMELGLSCPTCCSRRRESGSWPSGSWRNQCHTGPSGPRSPGGLAPAVGNCGTPVSPAPSVLGEPKTRSLRRLSQSPSRSPGRALSRQAALRQGRQIQSGTSRRPALLTGHSPLSPLPQAKTSPSLETARMCDAPQATCVIS